MNPAGDTAVLMATPTTSPQSPQTADLIRHLRADVLPSAGVPVSVGGTTASFVDQGDVTADRLPLFIGGVVILSILLLTVTFRSVTVALKAGVMNLLSIGAAYGVVAYLAEGGWAGQLVGIDTPTPVPPFIPVIMFAILFGLSMDYEVFLLSRVREEFLAGRSTSSAVTEGLARTARVITAAALIMVAVFGAFALSPEVFLKLIGIGMAAAILIDATIVRMVLVPAVMQLLGDRNWWLPRWIGRLLPDRAYAPGSLTDSRRERRRSRRSRRRGRRCCGCVSSAGGGVAVGVGVGVGVTSGGGVGVGVGVGVAAGGSGVEAGATAVTGAAGVGGGASSAVAHAFSLRAPPTESDAFGTSDSMRSSRSTSRADAPPRRSPSVSSFRVSRTTRR